MTEQQMREEFDKWLISTSRSNEKQGYRYKHYMTQILWEGWQASRQALISKRLPCSVKLEVEGSNGGIRIGKGCPVETLHIALNNRAKYEEEQALLSPEEKMLQQEKIKEFRKQFASKMTCS